MRWLVVQPGPAFSVHDVYAGWVEALRDLGQHVIEFPLGDVMAFYHGAHIAHGDGELRPALDETQIKAFATDRLAAALFKANPQVLFVVSAFFTDTRILDQARHYGTRVVLLMTESPYEDDRQFALASHADLVLLNDPTNLERYEAVASTIYAPHAYRPAIHHPGKAVPDLVCDLGFVGTGFPSRVEFFEAMSLEGLTVKFGGNWQSLSDTSPLRDHLIHHIEHCLDNDETADLYRSARAGINLYRREADADHLIPGWAMGPREVEMAACGLFFLRDPRPEGDRILQSLPTFAGAGDAAQQLRWWLDHPGSAETAAFLARQAIADRTFHNHATKLLRLFDRQPVTV